MKIGILGAGSIGCYVGGMLAAAGREPVLVGRAAMGERLSGGLELTRYDGTRRSAETDRFRFSDTPEPLKDCDAIFVCVKNNATREAGEALARIVSAGSVVVSLQNGVSNAAVLRECLPCNLVLAGMVAFNVAQIGPSRFHCGTEGEIVIEATESTDVLVRLLTESGIAAKASNEIEAVLWGKLLLNLNNAINALSGLPLKEELSARAYRQILATSIREALAVLKVAKIQPAKIAKVGPGLLPVLLELPDWVFVRLAASMLKIDAKARSSMAEDLERDREPEIDWLNGEIAALGSKHGIATPVNDRIIVLIKAAFSGKEQRAFSGPELKKRVLV